MVVLVAPQSMNTYLANVISLWCVSARHLPWNQLLTSAVIAIPSNFIMRHVMRPPNIDLHPQLRAFASWSPESNAVNLNRIVKEMMVILP